MVFISRQMVLRAVMPYLIFLELALIGVSAQFGPFPRRFRNPWGPQTFRGQFPFQPPDRMQSFTARGMSGRNPPSRQSGRNPPSRQSGRNPPSRQSGSNPPSGQPNRRNMLPWGQPFPGPPPFDQAAREMAQREEMSILQTEINPVQTQASGLNSLTSLILNSTQLLNNEAGSGLSPQQLLSEVITSQTGNSPTGSSDGMSQFLNFGKSLLESALNRKPSVEKKSPPAAETIKNEHPKGEVKPKVIENVKKSESAKQIEKHNHVDSGIHGAPDKDVYPKEISGPVNPSDVKQVNEPVIPTDIRPVDDTNPVKPIDVKPVNGNQPVNAIDLQPINTINVRPIDEADLVGVVPGRRINVGVQPGDVISPQDRLHTINPITGLPEVPHARPIGVVSPNDVMDRGHVHVDGTFHDFPVELHGNDTQAILPVLDPLTGETVLIPNIDLNSGVNSKSLDTAEMRAAWLMERKRARRLKMQNRRLRELLRHHMNEVHPSEMVPIDTINGPKPGDIIPVDDVIPSIPVYVPSATPSPSFVFPSDTGSDSGNPKPEPEPVLPGNVLGPLSPEPGDVIAVDVIPEPEDPGYIPSATPFPNIKVPGEKSVIGGKRPLQPGDVIPVDDIIPTVPGYVPSATAAPDFVFPKDVGIKSTGTLNPSKPKTGNGNSGMIILPATPAPVIKVPPTTRRPQPPPPPAPRRPAPPPPKKNNLLKNLGIGFAIGSLLFGK
ncbi:uncharacterized protein LOC125659518 isoform X2 [Ostrea edulis]|uniref:uncharacterized protein LOC125659518 isoform X2 n=1 Tax=Ostrea edulis TaxID=37623 RepID=UPI0024AFF1FB|nr:uncharacterized protein LOC125659518 isoform X2 [Ostrea edulis]